MKHIIPYPIIVAVIAGGAAFAVSGCSSKPTQDELSQLENVRAETTSLEHRKAALEQEKSALNQSIAQKEAQLSQCEADKTAVKARLAK